MDSSTEKLRALMARNAVLLARARAEHSALLDVAQKEQGLSVPPASDPDGVMDAVLYRGRVARLLAGEKS